MINENRKMLSLPMGNRRPGQVVGSGAGCSAPLSVPTASLVLRAPGWAGPVAGGEAPLHGPEDQHVPEPLPTLPGDSHGGLRPQPTGQIQQEERAVQKVGWEHLLRYNIQQLCPPGFSGVLYQPSIGL